MKILCIEDDPQDAELMRRALVNTAPQTTFEIVSTQREGLKRLSAQGAANYDIVLTDLKLTDGDGLAILSHIRRRGLPLAVVVVTGTGDEETPSQRSRAAQTITSLSALILSTNYQKCWKMPCSAIAAHPNHSIGSYAYCMPNTTPRIST